MIHVLIILALVPFALIGCMVILGLSMTALGILVRIITAMNRNRRASNARALAARLEYERAAKLRAAALRERYGLGGAIAIRAAWVAGVVLFIPAAVVLVIYGQNLFH